MLSTPRPPLLLVSAVVAPALLAGACQPEPLRKADNRAPEILSFVALPAAMPVGRYTRISAIALDPDGDAFELKLDAAGQIDPAFSTIEWTASGGDLTFSERDPYDVLWRAPEEPGSYRATIALDDGEFVGEAELTLEVYDRDDPRWGENHPPVVVDIVADPQDVAAGETVTVRAVVDDPDGDALNYVWNNDFSQGTWLDREGDTMQFTLGAQCCLGPHALNLTVDDGKQGVGDGRAWVLVVSAE